MMISVSPNSSSVGNSTRLVSIKSAEIRSIPAASRSRNRIKASRCDQSRDFKSGVYAQKNAPHTKQSVTLVKNTPRIIWRSNSRSFLSKPYETQVDDFFTASMLKSITFSCWLTVGCAVVVSLFFGDVDNNRIDGKFRSIAAVGRARINAAILNSRSEPIFLFNLWLKFQNQIEFVIWWKLAFFLSLSDCLSSMWVCVCVCEAK